jgi:hypothetical protein
VCAKELEVYKMEMHSRMRIIEAAMYKPGYLKNKVDYQVHNKVWKNVWSRVVDNSNQLTTDRYAYLWRVLEKDIRTNQLPSAVERFIKESVDIK